jgi:glycerate kinase
MAQALGARLLDARGDDVGPGGAALLDLDRIDPSGLAPEIEGVEFVVACDVVNPLVGPDGAAAVYGPQKGASPEDVSLLDRALTRYAEVLRRDLGVDVAAVPGAGAAGGLGAGLIAFLGGVLRRGIDVVMDATRFEDRLRGAGLVITGEGKLDEQSSRGKTAAGVVRAARRLGVPALIVAGQTSIHPPGVRTESLVQRFGRPRAFEDAAGALEDLVAEAAEGWQE